jgi:hypothetical protein
MKRKTLLLGFTAILVLLAASSEVKAWYAYHYSYHRGYGGYSHYSYGAYHYGGYGGYHYGYYRRY